MKEEEKTALLNKIQDLQTELDQLKGLIPTEPEPESFESKCYRILSTNRKKELALIISGNTNKVTQVSLICMLEALLKARSVYNDLYFPHHALDTLYELLLLQSLVPRYNTETSALICRGEIQEVIDLLKEGNESEMSADDLYEKIRRATKNPSFRKPKIYVPHGWRQED